MVLVSQLVLSPLVDSDRGDERVGDVYIYLSVNQSLPKSTLGNKALKFVIVGEENRFFGKQDWPTGPLGQQSRSG